MLVSEIISEIRDHGFDDLTEARVLGFINDAYYEMATREPWPFLETIADINTVAGSNALTMPGDFNKALSLTNLTTGRAIRHERRENIWLAGDNPLAASGEPHTFWFRGNSIFMQDVPDRVYSLRLCYIRVPAALTATPDSTPDIPAQHHRILVLGALVKAYMLEDDPELAAQFQNAFDRKLAAMQRDLWERQYDRPDRIVDLFDLDY